VGAIISVRELSAKRWKGFQRGGHRWRRRGADAALIAQTNDSPATGGSQAQRLMSCSSRAKYSNAIACRECKFSAIFYQIDPNYGVNFPFRA
jgi:hypothetical protein